MADLEECLAAEESRKEALHRKADAVCWVIERLRAEAAYHQGQAKRFSALARSEVSRADSLEASLLGVLTRVTPGATSFRLLDHKLTSRTADQVVIDNPDAIPPDLVTEATTKAPDKASIKERIKTAIGTPGPGVEQGAVGAVEPAGDGSGPASSSPAAGAPQAPPQPPQEPQSPLPVVGAFDPTGVFCAQPRSRIDDAVSQGLTILAGLALGSSVGVGGKDADGGP